jgi:hypothetical protein
MIGIGSNVRTAIVVVALSAFHLSCDSKPDLPPIAPKPEGHPTRRIEIAGCRVEIPPVDQDISASCGGDDIGGAIRTEDVCLLVTALKEWMSKTPLAPPLMQPDDGSRIRAITICRHATPPEPGSRGGWQISIEADVLDRPRLLWAAMAESDRKVSFGTVHRGGM